MTRGGKRKGAGRPTKPISEQKQRHNVTLSPTVANQLRQLGNGNLSRGIAIATQNSEGASNHVHPKQQNSI